MLLMVQIPSLPGFTSDPVVGKLPASARVYVVGGAVRDALLGLASSDKDWVVVGATVNDMLSAGFTPVGADFPVFLHPDTHEEYALARTERKSGHGYKGFTFHADPSVTLEDDLARRDFTVNAMAMNAQGQLIDPYGGLADLQSRLMRHVSPAFVEDPLRVLRLARFLARFLEFSVADETFELCFQLRNSGELKHLVAERVFAELNKGMGEEKPSRMIKLLSKLNAWPELGGESALKFAHVEDAALKTVDQLSAAFDRWVYQLSHLGSKDAVDGLSKRWRIPKEIQQAAAVFVELNKFLSLDKPDAPALEHVLERVDLYRRPERLGDVCRIFSQSKGERAQFPRIHLAVEQVQSGQYKAWISKAIESAQPGASVAEVVANAKTKWVEHLFQNTLNQKQ